MTQWGRDIGNSRARSARKWAPHLLPVDEIGQAYCPNGRSEIASFTVIMGAPIRPGTTSSATAP